MNNWIKAILISLLFMLVLFGAAWLLVNYPIIVFALLMICIFLGLVYGLHEHLEE